MQPHWIAIPLLLASIAGTAWAQYAPGSPPRSYTAGNVLYPGGVPPTPAPGSPILPMGGYGQPVSNPGGSRGSGSGSRGGGGYGSHPHHQTGVVVPVYLGVYAEDPQPQQQQAQPSSDAQDPAVVIVNQRYRPDTANPVMRDYSNANLAESASLDQRQTQPPPESIQGVELQPPPPPPLPPQDQSPTIYLIAMKDGGIVAALGYWVEGDTLYYITRDANRNQVSIDRVDRDFSAKLNADRQVPFKLE